MRTEAKLLPNALHWACCEVATGLVLELEVWIIVLSCNKIRKHWDSSSWCLPGCPNRLIWLVTALAQQAGHSFLLLCLPLFLSAAVRTWEAAAGAACIQLSPAQELLGLRHWAAPQVPLLAFFLGRVFTDKVRACPQSSLSCPLHYRECCSWGEIWIEDAASSKFKPDSLPFRRKKKKSEILWNCCLLYFQIIVFAK